MNATDLIILGALVQQPLSAYEIQKKIKSRVISDWVKLSLQDIYKQLVELQKKGFIIRKLVKESLFSRQALYSLSSSGIAEFKNLMMANASDPNNNLTNYNAVIVNLPNLSEQDRNTCLSIIDKSLQTYEQNVRKAQTAQRLFSASQQCFMASEFKRWLKSSCF